jgi:hypothetical protein
MTTMSDESADIQLKATHLKVANGVLQKDDGAGNVVARHDLKNIGAAALVTKTEAGFIFAGIFAVAFAGVAYFLIESPGWRWSAVVALLMIAAISVAIARQDYLELRCGDDKVSYNLLDPSENNQGFVVSLKEAITAAKQRQ